MSMKRADIIALFESCINDSKSAFKMTSEEVLELAILKYSRLKPRQGINTLTLVAEQGVYDAPADLIGFKNHSWGMSHRRRRDPWNSPRVVKIPEVKVVPGADGQRPLQLALSHIPSYQDISVCGSAMQYFYSRAHEVTDEEPLTANATTIPEKDKSCLLYAMLHQAMLHLAARSSAKANIKDPISKKSSRVTSPASLAKLFDAEFEKSVAE